jgi:predicted Rossmann fold flavoprotein
MKYNIIIVGGGAAGMMAAIIAKRNKPQLSVAIVEKNYTLGRKVLVTGAGRCNITNARLMKNYSDKYFSTAPDLVKSVFSNFGLKDITEFFTDLGLPLVEELKTNLGKVFPVSDQAKSVVEHLGEELNYLGVEVIFGSKVLEIKKNKGEFSVKIQNEENISSLKSDKVVLASGGQSYGRLGADASGYDLAAGLGHTIITPVPSTVPLESRNSLSKNCEGVKMFVGAKLFDGENLIQTREGDLLFTKYGVSGSVILSLSRAASVLLNRDNKKECRLKVDFTSAFPELEKELTRLTKIRGYMKIENFLNGYFPVKFVAAFLSGQKISSGLRLTDISGVQKKNLLALLRNYELTITGTLSFEEAEFSAGGVHAREVDPLTLQSLKTPDLFLCGEVLDVDGDIGGYNLSWAWSSGARVGMSL